MNRLTIPLMAQWAAAVQLGACIQPIQSNAAPEPGPKLDNGFLGRWQGNSTAGRAVLGVLTIEPKRVRWGTAMNGICDSKYSVEKLPRGQNGRFSDQLVRPTEPSNLVFENVRLTPQPDPCTTGVAMIKLAKPLDGSDSIEMVTYDTKGSVLGNYPDLTAVRQ